MSIKFASPLDMLLNSLLNLVLEKLAADPTTPTEGRVYWNTVTKSVRVADGTQWQDLGAAMSAGDILTALLTVDGDGSLLDADLLDGLEASAFALATHTHTSAQITDLPAVIDARILAAFTNEAVDATVDTIAEFTQLIKDNEGAIAAILSIKRHQENFGDGSAASYTITHNLNTLDTTVQLVEVATGETIHADVTRNGVNSVVIGPMSPIPTANQFRALVLA